MMPKFKPLYLMLWSTTDTKNRRRRNGFSVEFKFRIHKYRKQNIVTFVFLDNIVSYMMLPCKYYLTQNKLES